MDWRLTDSCSGSPKPGAAMRGLASRGFVSLSRTRPPSSSGINDDPMALRILQREFKRAGGENHYFFCGRDIVAYKAVQPPDRERPGKPSTSRKRVSVGVSRSTPASPSPTTRARPRSTSVTNEAHRRGSRAAENGVVIFKLLRNAGRRPRPRQGLHRRAQSGRDVVRRLRGPRALRRGRPVRLFTFVQKSRRSAHQHGKHHAWPERVWGMINKQCRDPRLKPWRTCLMAPPS